MTNPRNNHEGGTDVYVPAARARNAQVSRGCSRLPVALSAHARSSWGNADTSFHAMPYQMRSTQRQDGGGGKTEPRFLDERKVSDRLASAPTHVTVCVQVIEPPTDAPKTHIALLINRWNLLMSRTPPTTMSRCIQTKDQELQVI